MKKWHIVLLVAAIVSLVASTGAVMAWVLAGNVNADGDGRKSDFALFTTESATGFPGTDFVTCTARKAAHLHVTATNFDPDEDRIFIFFADGDEVTVRVPVGESFSLTQVMGTNKGVDTTIVINPQDNDGDASPMVGWVSIDAVDEGKVSCTGTLLQ